MWRKVRGANISQTDRDRFERYGETVVALLLASELTERPETAFKISFAGMYEQVIVDVRAATAWLTERADLHERREQRLEAVEWAIVIFVFIEVLLSVKSALS